MQLEPKLSNTWIGYASFLFEVIRLPVPAYLGNEKGWAQLPPQTNIVIENIFPRPLTQKVLTRCLNQSSDLVTFFAVRLLVLAFEKLSQSRADMTKAAKSSDGRADLWHEASERLLTRFAERCPPIKDVIATFRKIPDDQEHALQREAVTRLLLLYYDVMPLQSMEEQFDISTPLTIALVRNEAGKEFSEVKELRNLELEHLLQLARQSPGMRWFTKQGALEYSPILTLLKIHSKDFQNRQIRDQIHHVLLENNIVNSATACDALVALLVEVDDYSVIGPYLDDCFTRATRQPVKYLDYLESIALETIPNEHYPVIDERLPSNLVAVLLEQAPFVLTKPQTVKEKLEAWINCYIELLMHSDEKSDILFTIQTRFVELDGFNWEEKYTDAEAILKSVRFAQPGIHKAEQVEPSEVNEVAIAFTSPPVESENHPQLFKWAQKDLDMAIEDGDIDALMLCLCSRFPDIRAQALSQLYKLEDKLLKSPLEYRDPIYVLVGELIETYEHHCIPKTEPLPYLAGCFATNALRVQMEPAHCMYPKINKFLNKGPEWRISKMPNYWIQSTVLSLPEEDDAYWKEVQWVLDWLVDGLRTPADLEILRRAGVFERVMSLYSSPGAGTHKQVKEKVLEVIWRATHVDGGSTTLITRTGVLSWLDMVKPGEKSVEAALKKRIVETCDRAKIEEWSGLSVESL